ncbi:MAG TPA: hypothetical protein VNO52_04465 [Methylomirabilota bacterium]|nr:hypothetical protein [Methylomirabilota bacterium]
MAEARVAVDEPACAQVGALRSSDSLRTPARTPKNNQPNLSLHLGRKMGAGQMFSQRLTAVDYIRDVNEIKICFQTCGYAGN